MRARRCRRRGRCAGRALWFGSPAGPVRSRASSRKPAFPPSFSPVATRSPRYGQPRVSLPANGKAIRLPLSCAYAAPTGHHRNQTMSNPNRPFGWRKRIGLLSPTVIETAAYDFYRLAPDGVSMCATTSNIEQSATDLAGEGTRTHNPCKSLILAIHFQCKEGTRGHEGAGRTYPKPTPNFSRARPMRLTTATIRALALPPGATDKTYFDDGLPGFGLRLRASGAVSWVVQYDFGGKTKKVTRGTPAILDPGAARTKAKDILAAVRLGIDPAADKRQAQERAAETFGALLV